MSDLAENKRNIPILTGPTGSGKTGVCFQLLEKIPKLQIISSDSRQIYKHLSIGTDKPSDEVLNKYKFHLVDFVEPGDRYTAFDFVEESQRLISQILADSIYPPLISGGTGLYLKALVEGLFEIPDANLEYRQKLEDEVITKGPKYLFERLEKIDPLEAAKTHPHNIKRIIRGLEIFHLTGKPKSELIASQNKKSEESEKYGFDLFCLMPTREKLYNKINARVDQMIENGLLEEVGNLIKSGIEDKVRGVNVIGYNELFRYHDGDLSLDEAVNLIKQNSRRYAKRQITWFKGMSGIKYFDCKEQAFEVLADYYNIKN